MATVLVCGSLTVFSWLSAGDLNVTLEPSSFSGGSTPTPGESFNDHYSQAKLFWNSMSPVEKEHIISAFRFEVGKVKSKDVRRQVVHMFNRVDRELAKQIAAGVGVATPTPAAICLASSLSTLLNI